MAVQVGHGSHAERLGGALVHSDRVRVVEAEGRRRAKTARFEVRRQLVRPADLLAGQDLLVDRACVLGVGIDHPRSQSLEDDIGATEIVTVTDFLNPAGARQRGQRLGQNPRLGKGLGADRELGGGRRPGTPEEGYDEHPSRRRPHCSTPACRVLCAWMNAVTNGSAGLCCRSSGVPFWRICPSCMRTISSPK